VLPPKCNTSIPQRRTGKVDGEIQRIGANSVLQEVRNAFFSQLPKRRRHRVHTPLFDPQCARKICHQGSKFTILPWSTQLRDKVRVFLLCSAHHCGGASRFVMCAPNGVEKMIWYTVGEIVQSAAERCTPLS